MVGFLALAAFAAVGAAALAAIAVTVMSARPAIARLRRDLAARREGRFGICGYTYRIETVTARWDGGNVIALSPRRAPLAQHGLRAAA